MFDNDDLKLPDKNFMNCLRKAITCDQFQQITNDMLKTMSDEKEDFCKGNNYTIQEAKNLLYAQLIYYTISLIIASIFIRCSNIYSTFKVFYKHTLIVGFTRCHGLGHMQNIYMRARPNVACVLT